eukprot:CAMPEP_0194271276 /NCGR_PEP_ID=MMETSP0169-20130528/5111_1 /TAXON_ID=218684 /ORGANISM="Corethron pennatum, Strain L29A3" /LENGTH=244 /DNA_ID=CAMNT_0039013593 /DNA_START=318 /DNA_END=1052 /DNA_ORIENTATION=+
MTAAVLVTTISFLLTYFYYFADNNSSNPVHWTEGEVGGGGGGSSSVKEHKKKKSFDIANHNSMTIRKKKNAGESMSMVDSKLSFPLSPSLKSNPFIKIGHPNDAGWLKENKQYSIGTNKKENGVDAYKNNEWKDEVLQNVENFGLKMKEYYGNNKEEDVKDMVDNSDKVGEDIIAKEERNDNDRGDDVDGASLLLTLPTIRPFPSVTTNNATTTITPDIPYFWHVPKSGGTTMKHVLSAWYVYN